MAAGWSPVGSNGATNLKSGIAPQSTSQRTNRTGVLVARRRSRLTRGGLARAALSASSNARSTMARVVAGSPDVSMIRVACGLTRSSKPACAAIRWSMSTAAVAATGEARALDRRVAGDEPDLVADVGEPALDQLDRLDDDGRSAGRLARPRSPRGSAAGPPDGRSPRGRGAPPGPRRRSGRAPPDRAIRRPAGGRVRTGR